MFAAVLPGYISSFSERPGAVKGKGGRSVV